MDGPIAEGLLSLYPLIRLPFPSSRFLSPVWLSSLPYLPLLPPHLASTRSG